MSSPGGFPIFRNNEIRDLTASLLTEVCHNVHVEPELQSPTRESFIYATAKVQDGARLDISANGVWGGHFEVSSTPLHHQICPAK